MADQDETHKSSPQPTRREFLQLAAATAGSTTFLACLPAIGEKNHPYYGALHELPPGEILPQGWLRSLLQKQADGLTKALPRVSWPFTWPYWNGETKTEGTESFDVWGPWEQTAYWIDGATRLAITLQDEDLLKTASAPIFYTLNHPRQDGYLGPANFSSPTGNAYRWPHTVFFRAVAAYADFKHDTSFAVALRKHYLVDTAEYGKRVRDVTNIEAMLWSYKYTGDIRLLELAEKTWLDYEASIAPTLTGDGDLSRERILSGLPIKAHGVSYAEQSKLPTLLYLYTGKQDYLQLGLAAQERVFAHHMLVDGIPSTSEFYSERTGRDAHETCDIVDHMWTWGYELMASGAGIWGDRIERACFNAALGAIKNDWKALQYFSSPNQILATRYSNHIGKREEDRFNFAPNPAKHIACCAGNVHRILPNYGLRMWMRHGEGGLAATLYGPCTLKTHIAGQELEIVEQTEYPFEDHIHFTFHVDRPTQIPLLLRIPQWCKKPKLALNGKALPIPMIEKGFVQLRMMFHPNDTLTLHLPMEVQKTSWPDTGVTLERGPLVYSLPIEATWTSSVEPHWSTSDYPIWSAMPKSEWNYALSPGKDRLESVVKVEHAATTDDPWLNPPIRLHVPAKRVPSWKMLTSQDDPKAQFTPPVPANPKTDKQPETITLVPYGSTELRVTVFPLDKTL